jgi:aminoglycoside phosphotransferase (APT) family kinase protein
MSARTPSQISRRRRIGSMAEVVDTARAVRAGEEVDADALARFFAAEVPSLAGKPIEVKQFPGGHSNLTYLLRVGDQDVVMRRPPFGTKVKSAHDMGREYRILSALAGSYPRAPKPIAYTEDTNVIGAPFYLMERVAGVILRKELPPELNLDPVRFRKLCVALVDALAELHALDYRALGLADLGKPEGYVQRQVEGWTQRYFGSQTDDVPVIEQVAKWLGEHRPPDSGAALIHNDFKFDNVIFDASLERITGVLDWEMSTIGDPLMDLGTALSYWMQSDDGPAFQSQLFGVTTKPHMPTRARIAERYFERSGRHTDHLVFYYVFGAFKTAVILQQIYYRYAKGLTKDARFAPFILIVRAIADRAQLAIDRGAI